jgi:hemerythrin
VQPDQKVKKVKSVLEKLLQYTKDHFQHEESFMMSIKYPELSEHKIKHEKIIQSMNDFVKNLSKMKINEIEKELAHFIEIWFVSHIVYQDKKISQWITSHEIPEFSFSWKNSYSIGNTIVDAEHQELFMIASEAFKNTPSNEKKRKVFQTLNSLFKYFEKHFKNEEDYMKSLKYDKLEEHKKLHVEIMISLSTIIKNSISMDVEDIQEELSKFIEVSLVNHIVQEDKKIAYWVQFLKDLKNTKELKEV